MKDLVRQVLLDICPSSLVREVAERQAGVSPLWRTMGELSWPGLAIPAELGGVGLGFVEVCLVAEELGRVAAPGPYMATVTQFAPMVRETGTVGLCEKLLSRVAEGSVVGALAVSEANRWDLRRIDSTLRMADGRWILSGQKTAVLGGNSADELAIVARGASSSGDEGLCVALVPRQQVVVRKRTIIDPTLELVDMELNELTIDADRILLPPGAPNAAIQIQRAIEEATVAWAVSTVGTCRAIFESTLQYAKDRIQFDRPIGSFQAIKHRLADMYLAVERAHALVYFAAATIAEDHERRTEACALAKAIAGECQQLVAQDGLQLHGGIGYTWEHDLHFLLKRAKLGDVLFGSATQHRVRLASILGIDGIRSAA